MCQSKSQSSILRKNFVSVALFSFPYFDGNDDPVCKTAKKTDVYSGLLDSEGEGEVGMIWENGIETCTLSCKNRIASAMSDAGYSMLGAGARG